METDLDDGRDLGVDVVVGEVQPRPEGALVQQRVLVELDLAAGVALVQAHGAVGEVDHLPQDQLWSFREGRGEQCQTCCRAAPVTLHAV